LNKKNAHSFHIPVMGIGYTIDSPLKVAQYGISSVISLVDDILIEKMRKYYSGKNSIEYTEIKANEDDSRAKRVTSYLNMINKLVDEKFNNLVSSYKTGKKEFNKYLSLLPKSSEIISKINEIIESSFSDDEKISKFKTVLTKGSIDVNIMTKLDKDNFKGEEQLERKYNDAHSALRGFANSDVEGSIVFSAGINPALYNYIENFKDFYPDENMNLKKKVIVKVSDYRSAIIQGKYLAKKGIWVSEFRVESGLNCGGHAFASDGYLLGPILEEFKENRGALVDSNFKFFTKALGKRGMKIPEKPLEMLITAQGGVGTHEEHEMLLNEFNLDGIGWGSPFLLSKEVTQVDAQTIDLIKNASEDDYFLSGVSPIGVQFNNIKGTTKDNMRDELLAKGTPGSLCPKKFLVTNKDYSERKICTSSREYQTKAIEELKSKNLSKELYEEKYKFIVEKSCICVGLGTGALLNSNIDTKVEGPEVSICPGPNLAYYHEEVTLKDMTDHIYGVKSIKVDENRPNLFIKEISMYVDYIYDKINHIEKIDTFEKYLETYKTNMLNGFEYYKKFFANKKDELEAVLSFEKKILAI